MSFLSRFPSTVCGTHKGKHSQRGTLTNTHTHKGNAHKRLAGSPASVPCHPCNSFGAKPAPSPSRPGFPCTSAAKGDHRDFFICPASCSNWRPIAASLGLWPCVTRNVPVNEIETETFTDQYLCGHDPDTVTYCFMRDRGWS